MPFLVEPELEEEDPPPDELEPELVDVAAGGEELELEEPEEELLPQPAAAMPSSASARTASRPGALRIDVMDIPFFFGVKCCRRRRWVRRGYHDRRPRRLVLGGCRCWAPVWAPARALWSALRVTSPAAPLSS
jgi:hypothetical protein